METRAAVEGVIESGNGCYNDKINLLSFMLPDSKLLGNFLSPTTVDSVLKYVLFNSYDLKSSSLLIHYLSQVLIGDHLLWYIMITWLILAKAIISNPKN